MNGIYGTLLSAIAISLLAEQPLSAADMKVQLNGSPETVYRWQTAGCKGSNFPDTSARAYRDSTGTVHLLAPSSTNWSMVGPTLDKLVANCSPLMQGAISSNPAVFDDTPWIESVYTENGVDVFALLSNEWSSFRHRDTNFGKDGCTSPYQENCYFYAVTGAVSHDGGRSFTYLPGNHIVALLPFRYKPDLDRSSSMGYATVSNIIKFEKSYYSFIGVRGINEQKSGTCLIKTDNLAKANNWRGWDGKEFNVKFDNPYVSEINNISEHICEPLKIGYTKGMELRSVNWVPKFQKFIGVFWGRAFDQNKVLRPGMFYTTSRDLIEWSDPALLLPTALESECKERIVYPSFLDPTSTSRNFETLENHPYLYYVRFNRIGCKGTLDRDLVRIPLSIEKLN